MRVRKRETNWRSQTFENDLTSFYPFQTQGKGVVGVRGGGGEEAGERKSAFKTYVCPAAIVTLTCRILYSDEGGGFVCCWLLNVPATCECISGTGRRWNMQKNKAKQKTWEGVGARNVVATLLLLAKVICSSGWQYLRDLSHFLFWCRPHRFLASKGETYETTRVFLLNL